MPLLWSEDLLLTSFLFNCPTCPRILPGTHFIHLSIWLRWVLVAACRISGVQPELLAFRVGSLTGPPGEVPFLALIFDATFFPLQILFPNILRIVSGLPLLFTWFFFPARILGSEWLWLYIGFYFIIVERTSSLFFFFKISWLFLFNSPRDTWESFWTVL